MTKQKILIVEDEAIIAVDLKLKLELGGYEVAGIVSSGEAALDHVEKNKPDLVIMDIILDGAMNGVEAAAEISKRCPTPILYLSAHSEKDLLEESQKDTLYYYLLKPASREELEQAVKRILKQE
ncbi:MAG TPA: response regulator [bacterium]|nr:response regulator [bacterium]HPN42541.1 response regulator [bacterium]